MQYALIHKTNKDLKIEMNESQKTRMLERKYLWVKHWELVML